MLSGGMSRLTTKRAMMVTIESTVTISTRGTVEIADCDSDFESSKLVIEV